jgi:Cysteine-rich CPCC
MREKQLFIRGDLNDLYDGIIPLRNTVWIALLKKAYGENLDGKQIWLYENTGRDGRGDPLIFPGVVKEVETGEYEISVNERDFKHLSEVEEFRGYSAEDIGAEFKAEHERQFGKKRNNEEQYPCPCCGYLTIADGPGQNEICQICLWEDDLSQLRFPTMRGGANKVSLVEAQQNYLKFGASDERRLPRARKLGPDDKRDPLWRPIDATKDQVEIHEPGKDEGKTYPKDLTDLYYWRKKK